MKYVPKDIRDVPNPNVTPTHPLKELFVLLLGALGCIVGAYIVLGFLVDWVVPKISFETEEKMAALFAPFDHQRDGTTDVERRLQAMVDEIQDSCTHLPYTISVGVADEPMINAVALPGGRIVVFQGLLDNVRSENEIAFILGHEMGHFANRDHLRGLGRGLVLLVVSTALFGADSSVSDLIADTITITEMSFSRAQETRADEYGLAVLNCSFGHVTGATDFFEKIPKESDPGRFGHYFSSHPENQRRIARLKRIAEEKKFPEGRRIPWEE